MFINRLVAVVLLPMAIVYGAPATSERSETSLLRPVVVAQLPPTIAQQENPPASSSAATQLQPAGRQQAANDPNLEYEARCKQIADITKIDSIEAKFAALRDARQNVLQAIQQAVSARDALKNRLEDRNRELVFSNRGIAMAYSPPVETFRGPWIA